MMSPVVTAADERRHHDSALEEWVFAAWTEGLELGLVSGHRVVNRTNWYWAALARRGRPLLHITDFAVPVRTDPFIIKGEQLWAEHVCEVPLEQWSIGNETYAAGLDDPDEALGRAYGDPTPIAFDLEWYATAPADRYAATAYHQAGVVHGRIEIAGEPPLDLAEIPAARWHRWAGAVLPDVPIAVATAHTNLRAPFLFPDGSVQDLVLTPAGWALRRTDRRPAG